jgi:hypothetical protein
VSVILDCLLGNDASVILDYPAGNDASVILDCPAGTWNVSLTDTSYLNQYLQSDSAYKFSSLAVSIEQGVASMSITFIVKNGDDTLETAQDSVTFKCVNALDSFQNYSAHGHFALSPDSSRLILNLVGDLLVDTTISAKVSANTTGAILDFGARVNPIFVGSDGYNTAELFYRAGNSI